MMYITHGFVDGLGNNGFTSPIISSCLEISSVYNPSSSGFPIPVAFIHCNVYRFNRLHKILPLLPFATMYMCKIVSIY